MAVTFRGPAYNAMIGIRRMSGDQTLRKGVKRCLSSSNRLLHGSSSCGKEGPHAQPEEKVRRVKAPCRWSCLTSESLDYHCTSSRELTEEEKTGGNGGRRRKHAEWLACIGERPLQPRISGKGRVGKKKKREAERRRKSAANIGY